MKKGLLFITALVLSFTLYAQRGNTVGKYPGRTQFFAEVGGPGILFSANIDTRFNTSSLGWGGRIGLGFYTGDEYNYGGGGMYGSYYSQSVVTVPLQVRRYFR